MVIGKFLTSKKKSQDSQDQEVIHGYMRDSVKGGEWDKRTKIQFQGDACQYSLTLNQLP